ncbi:MAG TPA: AMP-binding protein, partial [Xanthobacteraceae bacterium]
MQDLAILESSERDRTRSAGRDSQRAAAASMNAAEVLLGARLTPAQANRPALIGASETLTYAELAARVARFAAGLRCAGLQPGQRLALLMLDTPDLVALYLAAMAV